MATQPPPPPAPKKDSFLSLNTLDAANTGAKLVILDTEGKPTVNWLTVRGSDSTAFQLAKRRMHRAAYDVIEERGEDFKKSDDYSAFGIAEQTKLTASLVSNWSFDEPCTPENVFKFLTIAPYVMEQVDAFASKRSRFVKG